MNPKPDAGVLADAVTWLERLLELDSAQRADCLRQLHVTRPELAAHLRRLLSADERTRGPLELGLAALAPQALAELAAVQRPAPQHHAGELIGVWRLLHVLGAGGMGEVWLCERADAAFSQKVALKLLRQGLTPDSLARFHRERQMLAQLQHPGIAQLIDGGNTADGRPYFALEFVDGEPITVYAASRALNVRDRVTLVIDLCLAVDFAHRRLIVHRDVKPSNVLVSASGTLKVLDFGIAKSIEQAGQDADTITMVQALSPAYAAPEQILGEPVAVAADIYAIGLVLYELLARVLPQGRGASTLGKLAQVVDQDVSVSPSAALKSAPKAPQQSFDEPDTDLDLIVLQALRREPEQRYRSAADLADDLTAWLNDLPVRARRSTRGYRLRKFVARNRLMVVTSVVAVVLIVAALALALQQRQAALRNLETAQVAALKAQRAKRFLASLFDAADPYNQENQGERSTVDLLESAPAKLRREFAAEPDIAADLLYEVGSSLRRLGRRDSARAALQEVLALHANHPGMQIESLAAAQAELGFDHIERGELAAAHAALEQAQQSLDTTPGDNRLLAINVRSGLAHVASQRGDLLGAMRWREQVLRDRIALLGNQDPDVAMDYSNLATAYANLGRYRDVDQVLRRSHEILLRRLGPTHLRTLYVLRNIVNNEINLGRFDDAQQLIGQIVASARGDATGAVGVDVANVSARIALYEYRLAQALEHADAVLSANATQQQKTSAMRMKARALQYQGDFAQAAVVTQQLMALERSDYAASLPALWSRFLFALMQFESHVTSANLSRVREVYAALAANPGGGFIRFEIALEMGRCERMSGNWDEALRIHRDALAQSERDSVLGAFGLALANAEIALDLWARNQGDDRAKAQAAAAESSRRLGATRTSDPRFAAMRQIQDGTMQ